MENSKAIEKFENVVFNPKTDYQTNWVYKHLQNSYMPPLIITKMIEYTQESLITVLFKTVQLLLYRGMSFYLTFIIYLLLQFITLFTVFILPDYNQYQVLTRTEYLLLNTIPNI